MHINALLYMGVITGVTSFCFAQWLGNWAGLFLAGLMFWVLFLIDICLDTAEARHAEAPQEERCDG